MQKPLYVVEVILVKHSDKPKLCDDFVKAVHSAKLLGNNISLLMVADSELLEKDGIDTPTKLKSLLKERLAWPSNGNLLVDGWDGQSFSEHAQAIDIENNPPSFVRLNTFEASKYFDHV